VGLCNVVAQEFSGIRCRLIDVDCARPQSFRRKLLIEQLLNEMTLDCPQGMVCYRNGLRWIQSFEKLPVEAESLNSASSVVLRQNGVYLLTGGTGRIGLVLAKYLVEVLSAKVILVSRTGIPWNDRNNQALEPRISDKDSNILMISADCTDLDEMRCAFSEAENRFGSVHGVLHLAGIAAEGLQQPIMDLTTEECERQFGPKIMGVLTLERILRDKHMDFCLLFSSLSATLGGLGFGAYGAANCFLNSFAECQNRTATTRWISVQWDGWNFDAKNHDAEDSVGDLGLSTEEGTEALARILEGVTDASQIIVSAGDLDKRVLQWLRPRVGTPPFISSDSGPHGRPSLRSAFVKPEGQTQQVMVDIWEQLLGIEPIGVQDNFFEMGGDSLLGLQLFARIRERFEADLPVPLLYKHPTPAELTSALEAHLVTVIGSMSEEQILHSLNEAR
jgi:NADP-dependent 3-hydroxy acid dehydrogenase YdfG